MTIEHPVTDVVLKKLESRIIKSDDPNGCWVWSGATNHGGYGLVYIPGTKHFIRAHRLMYQLHNGPLETTELCLHHCDNPPCCNPAHLWKGTQLDNIKDRHSKGRTSPHGRRNKGQPNPMQSGESNGNSKLTEDIVRYIRTIKLSNKKLAAHLGISCSTVENIRTRKTWKHSV